MVASTTRPLPRIRAHRRAFTLVELIVVILIIGVLAAIGVVGYSALTGRAQVAAANANLSAIATAALAHHTAEGASEFTRAGFLASLDDASVTVVDKGTTAADQWGIYGTAHVPTSEGDFAVGFDYGQGTTAGDVSGTRAAVVTAADGKQYARVVTFGQPAGDEPAGAVPAGTSPTQVLADPTIIGQDPAPSTPGKGAFTEVASFGNGWGYSTGGRPLEMSGSTLISGDELQNSVNVYVRSGDTWQQQATLRPTDAVQVGSGATIDGDRIVVPGTRATLGQPSNSLYIFDRTDGTWTQTQRITPPAGTVTDRVAISGTTLAFTTSTGVFIYELSHETWQLQHQFSAAELEGTAALSSWSVVDMDIDANTIAVSTDSYRNSGGQHRSLMTLERDGAAWTARTVSTPLQTVAKLSLDGDRLATYNDATYDAATSTVLGYSASVYARTSDGTWAQYAHTPVETEIAHANDIALSGDTLAIGVLQYLPDWDDIGRVHLYDISGGALNLRETLSGSAEENRGEENAIFGATIALSDGTLAVGGSWVVRVFEN